MPPQPGTMRSRWTAYAALSTTLAAGVILKSLAQRPNFYSATVYLSQSSANLMILCNMVFVTACSVLLLLQKFLYGPLRSIEIEQLYEKAWFAVTETCLAMTIFRGEIGAWFLVMFFSLLAGKVWGWIGEGRVEVLEQQQHNIIAGSGGRLFYTRLAASLALSVLFDMTMLQYVVGQVLHMARPDMMVMFGFEFAVLTVTSLSTATRFSLNLIEIGIVRGQKQKRMEAIRKERIDAAVREIQGQENAQPAENGTQPAVNSDLERRRQEAATAAAAVPIDEAEVEVEGWEGKGQWVFYLDLMTDFCKLVIYLSFFFILLIFYGLPLHIMRDVFLTCRSFVKRIGDFMRYRTATRDMNERYPDATEAEISDNECIICREEMRPYVPPAPGAATDPLTERMRPKKLPCGHVLHFSCLRSWLERQQICPTCRATVVPSNQAAPGAVAAAGGVAAAAAPGAPARPQHPPNGGNGRPRVFQLGPLRIGIGAARGNNMFEDLQEQLANLNALPEPAPVPAQNANGPRQYGFGIRWDGMRRRAQAHRAPRGSVQDNLDSVERQIQREVDSLQASMAELQALREVQGQLARIRLARQAPAGQQAPPVASQTLPTTARPIAPTTVTGLAGNTHQGVLQAGSEQLPDGLTLPEGWTMMPLQPMQPQHFAQPIPFSNSTMMPNFPIPQMPQIPQMNIPIPTQPQATAQQPNAGSSIANILRETRDVLQSNATQNGSGQQSTDGDPVEESIRLQQEIAQSEERMADLTGQMRNIGQTIANTTAESQSASTNSVRGPVSLSQTQTPSQRQSPGPIPHPLQQMHRGQVNEQTRSPVTTQTRYPQPSNQQTSTRASSSPQVAPQMSRSVPSRNPNINTTSRPNPATTMNPPRQLAPVSRTSSNDTTESRTRSPHRPTRSIGSSWGFSGVEQDKSDDDDDDNDDDEENEEEDENTTDEDSDEKTKTKATTRKKTTNGYSSRSTKGLTENAGTSSGSQSKSEKKATVEEDLSDDSD